MLKKCCACGQLFRPTKEAVYSVYEPQTVLESLTSRAKQFDVMDCPRCGCQNILAERLPAIRQESEAAEDD